MKSMYWDKILVYMEEVCGNLKLLGENVHHHSLFLTLPLPPEPSLDWGLISFYSLSSREVASTDTEEWVPRVINKHVQALVDGLMIDEQVRIHLQSLEHLVLDALSSNLLQTYTEFINISL